MVGYKWRPIEPISDRDRAIDLAAIKPLYETWWASKERLEESSQASLKEFNERLVRRLSVETGIIERLYDLDRGTTEALVIHGFVEDLVSRASTDIEPFRLIDILRDQEAAIQLMVDCVAGSRDLTRGLIHELHSVLTRHQDTTSAMDQFGNRFEIPLLKAKFKEHPNNPRRQDGSIHEYCPPIHVDSEMDLLLAYLSSADAEDPIIATAWFHHRFTQIHPYQDGNGRVVRALSTLILLRANLLPLVIHRDLRLDYIEALETADAGDLSRLASLFAALERDAILRALSIDSDKVTSRQQTLTAEVIESLSEKLVRRHQVKLAELRTVNGVAVALQAYAHEALDRGFNELKVALSPVAESDIRITDGGPDHGNAHWYKFEVIKSANEAGKFANFIEAHYFVKASIMAERERLVFVASFHHVGRDLSGIMEVTAFSQLRSIENSEDRESVSQDFILCSPEPFVFTYKTDEKTITETFARWLDVALAVAIKEYGDRL